MEKKVLVIGGCGRIGGSVAQDILTHTNSTIADLVGWVARSKTQHH